mgnify:CR=1 FL=1
MEFLFANEDNINEHDLNSINNHFKLPIYYIEDKIELSSSINDDLELYSESNNDTGENKLYDFLFNPTNPYAKNTIKEWGKYYTHDVKFLNDSQNLIKNLKNQNLDRSQAHRSAY